MSMTWENMMKKFKTIKTKKVRGVNRRWRVMANEICRDSEKFPMPNLERGEWHMHMPLVPFKPAFIDSPKIPFKIKRATIQLLISRVEHLIAIKPKIDITSRVVACIDTSGLNFSQIIVFFGDQYFSDFFKEIKSELVTFTVLPSERNFEKEWKINIPKGLEVKGYLDKSIEENDCGGNYTASTDLWFIGELT